jgi:vacuolar protein sorting-associated protein 13A/C
LHHQGNIHLQNVRLKETALAALDLPIDVTFGIVKRVVIKIPWTALTKKPTIVIVDGIHALIRNRTDFSGDESAKQKLQRALHLRGISAFERTLAEEEERDKEFEKTDGKKKQDGADAVISSKFLVSIVDNLQVTIRNIHLRYVDETSFIGHRCAIGLAIHEITVYVAIIVVVAFIGRW